MNRTGIFNPYAEKKPPPKRKNLTLDRGISLAEEMGMTEPESSIRLDGGSFILELRQLDLKDVPGRLGNLLKDVIQEHPAHMSDRGIQLVPRKEQFNANEDELVLPTPTGHLIVYVGSEMNEDAAYRRIAHALMHLPIKNILAKHQARIIVRS